LTFFGLTSNSIGDPGVKAIATALKDNKSVAFITFSINEIKADGFRAIGEMLQVNSTLSFLNLYFNAAEEEGGKIIQQYLEKPKPNMSLVECRLAENEQNIKPIVSRNQTIQSRLAYLWSKVSPVIAFSRANFENSFRDSILQLIPDISKFMGPMEQLVWTRL